MQKHLQLCMIYRTNLIRNLKNSQSRLLVWVRTVWFHSLNLQVWDEAGGKDTKALTQYPWTSYAGKPVGGGDVLEMSAGDFFGWGIHLFDLEVNRPQQEHPNTNRHTACKLALHGDICSSVQLFQGLVSFLQSSSLNVLRIISHVSSVELFLG